MKMTVIRDHFGDTGMVTSGSVIEVSDGRARELESKKLAVRAIPRKLQGATADGNARPTQTPPAGGKTGAVEPALSSPPAPVPQKQASKARRGRRA